MSDRNIFREWGYLLEDAMDRVRVTVDELHAIPVDERTPLQDEQKYRLQQTAQYLNQIDGELRQHAAERDHELELLQQVNPLKRLLTWLNHELRHLMGRAEPLQ